LIDGLLRGRPRVRLAHLPTPLEPCDRLRDAVGGPRVWIKRDDCTGLAGGGNKTRKLEFLLGRAIAAGADGVITFGALQSNHARQTAAACARLGLSCDLVLTRMVPRTDEHYARSGNVVLDRLLGARLHVVDDADGAVDAIGRIVADAEREGRKVEVIGPGGSDAIGALGYVAAAGELAAQVRDAVFAPSRIVLAASTCGTAAGLIVGASLGGSDAVVDIACVYEPADITVTTVRALVAACADELGVAPPPDARWTADDSQLGDGYGIPSDTGLEAMRVLARTEGVLLDPVYTGKAFALLLERIAQGALAVQDDVVFWHTGGAQGVSAYTAAFEPK
jgi:D-cysteine desulfhydrase family pyridoxal phosphate-dependent enzyme